MKDLLLKELAKKINAPGGGNCPDDPGCIFGFGMKRCSASKKVIEEKFAAFKAKEQSTETDHPRLFMICSHDTDAWPCARFTIIVFKDPE